MARIQKSADSSQQRRVWIWFVAAGVALGLALYTYPAARTLPIIFFLFWILTSIYSRKASKSLLITLLTALIVFAPQVYTIATQPEADVRLQQLGGPLQEALKGIVEPVLRYTLTTLGMFNIAGDPIARYNLPGRPVFDVITGILFLLGLLIALRRWREPRNLFALLWLREWVTTRLDARALAERLTLAGLEVGSVSPVAAALDHVVVGEILSIAPHPQADRLRVCQVDVGQKQPLAIVCGAENAAAGLKAPAALEGAVLPNGTRIAKAVLRGVESSGMLCSAAELGLEENARGLLVLPASARPGTPIGKLLGLDDHQFEVELTPNRGDCLSSPAWPARLPR